MIRSIVISFFVFAVSCGMVMVNEMNASWMGEHDGRPLFKNDMSPYLEYDEMGVPLDKEGYNSTMRDIASIDAPIGLDNSIGLLQNLKYAVWIGKSLFSTMLDFPQYLTIFGMPQTFVTPLIIFLFINHILAFMYIVTGRTFIY